MSEPEPTPATKAKQRAAATMATGMVFLLLESLFTFRNPSFITDDRFKHDPFLLAVVDIGACVVIFTVYVFGLCQKEPHWLQYFINSTALMGLALWIWRIVVLDSSDANILRDDYRPLYTLWLVMVILPGIVIMFGVLFLLIGAFMAAMW